MSELKKHIYDENNGLYYTLVGDYYIPDLELLKEDRLVGRWGRMHRDYLKENCPAEYTELIIKQLMESEGVTEKLKKCNQLEWVRRCNSIRNRAEEIIKDEMIYR